ncbi:MAG: hypothetical protein K9L30_03735 [Desulfobacterales bacterium]|nr:hypothetical protein [Desulfobacterales bacterium]
MDLERRQNMRFNIRDKAYAADLSSDTILGTIVDIGNDGLAFLYSENEEILEKFKAFSIYVPGQGYCLKNATFKSVYEIHHEHITENNEVRTLRRGIRFKTLTGNQTKELEAFIFYHTTTI